MLECKTWLKSSNGSQTIVANCVKVMTIKYFPVGSNSICWIHESKAKDCVTHSPVSTSQNRTKRSSEALANKHSAGLKQILVI